jgi:phosphatidate cytidylyltransferase
MKLRITTGLSAGLLALAGLIWIETPLVLCLVVGFSVIAAHEICHAVQMKNRAMIAVSMAMAALLPPVLAYWPAISGRLHIPALLLLLGYLLLLLALLLARFEETRCSHVLYALLASLLVPGGLAAIPMLRNFAPGKNLAVWLLLFTLCGAWATDIFALFVGVKFGKHKLAPKISPKKTVEGAIGGLAGCVLMNVGFALLFNRFFLEQHRINLLGVALLSLAAGVVSMMGDLAASVLKRNHGVKDFGKIFPGHGGVMDCFDSLVLVTPFVYALLQLQQSLGLDILYRAIV